MYDAWPLWPYLVVMPNEKWNRTRPEAAASLRLRRSHLFIPLATPCGNVTDAVFQERLMHSSSRGNSHGEPRSSNVSRCTAEANGFRPAPVLWVILEPFVSTRNAREPVHFHAMALNSANVAVGLRRSAQWTESKNQGFFTLVGCIWPMPPNVHYYLRHEFIYLFIYFYACYSHN